MCGMQANADLLIPGGKTPDSHHTQLCQAIFQVPCPHLAAPYYALFGCAALSLDTMLTLHNARALLTPNTGATHICCTVAQWTVLCG